ncbi:MAG TPA: DUF1796 family putative cysteine peptidase, partial [Hyphomicrobiales bacterium]|nr:DUF1796 family putative cysteine peptidase [Hyphomicrobiales bacterium]
MSLPLFSVVMPTRNQAAFIERSIRSVLDQDYANLELIVADGDSTDGTQAILQRLAEADPRLRWFSEPDSGPANALNKALAQVKGTLVGWLNSDDLYTPGALSRAAAALEANPTHLLVYGHGQHIDAAGKVLEPYPTQRPEGSLERFLSGCFICQPTVVFRRTLVLLNGKLDESLGCAFDFDYWLRAFRKFPDRLGFVDAVQAQSRLHDGCITQNARRQVALEGLRVLYQQLQQAPKEWVLTYMEELLAGPAMPGLRRHLEQTVEEAAPWLPPNELQALRQRVNDEARLDQREFPPASNCCIPGWEARTFRAAISLGNFCHAAQILKLSGIRKFSGPFDWLFTNLNVVAHCLGDDFQTFLDPGQYQVMPPEQRPLPEANVCDHAYYRDTCGVRFMFNHHDPSGAKDHGHFERTVERFRNLRHSHAPVLFLLVTNMQFPAKRYEPLVELLRRYVDDFLLLAVRFAVDAERPDKPLTLVHSTPQLALVDFPVAAASNGVEFPDRFDNIRFEAFIRSFRVDPREWGAAPDTVPDPEAA